MRLPRRYFSLLLVPALLLRTSAAAQEPGTAPRIAAATLPLPPSLRSGATVIAWRGSAVDTLRPGVNGMTCLADIPGDTLFDVRCYHDAFWPILFRRRQLVRDGADGSTMSARIDQELQDGTLPRPPGPTAGYRMLGPIRGYDATTNTVTDEIDRWQSIHMPYATARALGMSEEENGIEPYMMWSGTWWAHVMIMERELRY